MYAELLALVASFCTALSTVLATKGMRDSNADSANLVMTGVQTAVLTALLISDIPPLDMWALMWFALSGVCASFVGRLLTLQSYKLMGVAVSSAIVGTSPLLVTLFAILFLGEPLLFSVVVGSALVVAGIAFMNMRGGRPSLKVNSVHLAAGASLMFAASNIFRKLGTDISPHAVLGAQSSTLFGFMTFMVYMVAKGGFGNLNINRGNIWWLTGSGVVNAVAWIALTMSIATGRVSVMTSIVYSYPLFSVLLARLMLRDTETLTRHVVAGCVLIVLGVVLVSLLG
jgi:drug/metabolite transporter (DMT)-like permease